MNGALSTSSACSTEFPVETAHRKVRVCYFNTWSKRLSETTSYLEGVPNLELRTLVTNPSDAALLTKARLDCDWYAENARSFAAMRHERLQFLTSWITGSAGLIELAEHPRFRTQRAIEHPDQGGGTRDRAGKRFARSGCDPSPREGTRTRRIFLRSRRRVVGNPHPPRARNL